MNGRGVSTTAGLAPNPRAGSRGVWLRRGFLGLLAVIVAVGLLDLLGVKSRTVTAKSADGTVTLRVLYPHIARAGLDVPFDITVERAGGFTGDVTITMSNDYLALFDRSGIDPQPTSSTATDNVVIWRFAPPPGSTLQVSLDMQVQGGRHWGRPGTVSVLDDNGRSLATAHFKTWLIP